MSRVVFFLLTTVACSMAQAQTTDTGGGNAIGGELETTEIEERGIEVGPTTQNESGFLNPEESGFLGPGGANFQSRTFNGGQTRQITNGGSTTTQRQVRPRFRLGFVPSASVMARSRQRAVSRFNSIVPRVRTLSGVSITPDQTGTVTLRGQANSRYDQLLAAAIARLQPGVRRINNEVRVASTITPQAQPLLPSQQQAPLPQSAAPQNVLPQRIVPQNVMPQQSVPVQTPPEIIVPLDPPQPVTAPLGQPQGSIIVRPPVPPAASAAPRR